MALLRHELRNTRMNQWLLIQNITKDYNMLQLETIILAQSLNNSQ